MTCASIVATRDLRPIQALTLLLWGTHDPYLGIELTQELSRWVPNLHLERIQDASHWVQNDTPHRVNELLLAFLRSS